MKTYELEIMTKTPGIYKKILVSANSFEEVKQLYLVNNYITKDTKVWGMTLFGQKKLPLNYWYGDDWENKIMALSPDGWYDTFFGKYWYEVKND